MVLDTHAHCWGPPTAEHPWTNPQIVGGEDEFASGDFLADFSVDLVYTDDKLVRDMQKVVVDEAVVVGYPINPWTDNYYTVKAVENNDELTAVVMIDQFADDAIEKLEQLMGTDGVVGIRLGVGCPYDEMWSNFDPSANWLPEAAEEEEFWAAVEALDAPVHIWSLPAQIDQVIDFVDRYPELTYVLDHHLYIRGDVRPGDEPFEELGKLAAYDNVAVKVSGVVTLSDERFPYPDKHDHLVWMLETFGRERVAWGSDWPNESNAASYVETLNWLRHVDQLSEQDFEWITGRSFKRHIAWDRHA
jgi:predicted TIM-barrel fold metal-dependent hydrolase